MLSNAFEEPILYLLLMLYNPREINMFITKMVIQIEQLAFEIFCQQISDSCVVGEQTLSYHVWRPYI